MPRPQVPHTVQSLIGSADMNQHCLYAALQDQIKGYCFHLQLLQPWPLEMLEQGLEPGLCGRLCLEHNLRNYLSFIGCFSGCPQGLLTLGPRPTHARSCRWEAVGAKPASETSLMATKKCRRRLTAVLPVWLCMCEDVMPRAVAAVIYHEEMRTRMKVTEERVHAPNASILELP